MFDFEAFQILGCEGAATSAGPNARSRAPPLIGAEAPYSSLAQ